MTRQGVRKSLLEHSDLPKEIRLNDGSRLIVRNREHWIDVGEFLIVARGRFDTHVAYHNIAAIRGLPQSARTTGGRG